MLPSELLIAKVRGWRIRPEYAPIRDEYLEIAGTLINVYREHVGKKRWELEDALRQYEEIGFDYRFIRGLSAILRRYSVFEPGGPEDSMVIRRAVFEEAAKVWPAIGVRRAEVMGEVARMFRQPVEKIEEQMWGDLEDEQVLRRFSPPSSADLLMDYNFSLTQTLLLRSTGMHVSVSGGWKNLLWGVKRLCLIYHAEPLARGVRVYVDGPLSIFKLTEKYGNSLAKLLETIVECEDWYVRASIVRGARRRVYTFELGSREAKGLLKPARAEPARPVFDSSVEERFFSEFSALGSGWRIVREPAPLIAGRHLLIPDFMFEKASERVYLEIVGFWTPEYLERKVEKLKSITGVNLILAVNEELACSKLLEVKARVVRYKREVPLKPILDYLREVEERGLRRQVEELKRVFRAPTGDVVRVSEISSAYGVSEEAVKVALGEMGVAGYRLVGNLLLSDRFLAELDAKLSPLVGKPLPEALSVLEGSGEPLALLEALGYSVEWRGIDLGRAVLSKRRR